MRYTSVRFAHLHHNMVDCFELLFVFDCHDAGCYYWFVNYKLGVKKILDDSQFFFQLRPSNQHNWYIYQQ